jgi:thiol-disulfide isomerase/thioredoxin
MRVSAMSVAARHRAAFAGIAVLGGIFVAAPVVAQDGGISIGASAPSPVVQTLQGKSIDLAQVAGRGPALLEFWATWCPNCKELAPAMAAAAKKYGGQVRFVTVAVAINESLERVQKHAAAYPLPGTVVYDADGNAASAYDAPATSYVVIIDRAGRVAYTGVGGTQDLDAAIRKVL